MNKGLISVSIPNIIKIHGSSSDKYISYVLVLTLVSKEKVLIQRRYNDFYELQLKLLKKFRNEIDGNSERALPYLPGKNILTYGKTHLALKRIEGIQDYCNKLIKLDESISCCKDVIQFFTPKDSDITSFILNTQTQGQCAVDRNDISNPVELIPYKVTQSYKKEGGNQVSVDKGEVVELLHKTTTGWWLIHYKFEMGYFPCAYLKPANIDDECIYDRPLHIDDSSEDLVEMLCIQNYEAAKQKEISLVKGSIIKPIRRQSDGWWLIDNGSGKTGYAPVSFMRPLNTSLLEMNPDLLDKLSTRTKSCDNLLLLDNEEFLRKEQKPVLPTNLDQFQKSSMRRDLSPSSSDTGRMYKAKPNRPIAPARLHRQISKSSSDLSQEHCAFDNQILITGKESSLQRIQAEQKPFLSTSTTNLDQFQKSGMRRDLSPSSSDTGRMYKAKPNRPIAPPRSPLQISKSSSDLSHEHNASFKQISGADNTNSLQNLNSANLTSKIKKPPRPDKSPIVSKSKSPCLSKNQLFFSQETSSEENLKNDLQLQLLNVKLKPTSGSHNMHSSNDVSVTSKPVPKISLPHENRRDRDENIVSSATPRVANRTVFLQTANQTNSDPAKPNINHSKPPISFKKGQNVPSWHDNKSNQLASPCTSKISHMKSKFENL